LRKLVQAKSRKPKMTAKSKSRKAARLELPKPTTVEDMVDSLGGPSGFVCPECKGPLWEMRNGHAMHFRCLVGHDYSPNNLSSAYGEELETQLWKALRSLEERIELQRRLAHQAGRGKQRIPQNAFRERADLNKSLADQLKNILAQLK